MTAFLMTSRLKNSCFSAVWTPTERRWQKDGDGEEGEGGRRKLRGLAPDHRLQEQQPLRDQCLSASPCAKQRRGKSSQTRAHCHGILATVSVSQVTGTDITSRPCVKQSSVVEPVWADRPCTYSTWRARTCVRVRENAGGVRGASGPCAHAASLVVRGARGSGANCSHLVELLGSFAPLWFRNILEQLKLTQ